MKCIVPLAGPDLYNPETGFRPLSKVEGGDGLLETAIEGRAWRKDGTLQSSDYVFVVREVEQLAELRAFLASRWPGSKVVTLSALTGGALLSALAGVTLAATDEPLCIDLADIFFDGPDDFWRQWRPGLGGCTPSFIANDPVYSYLRKEGGRVVEAAEKRVISDHASAGVYFFRDAGVYLSAAAHSLANRKTLAFKGNLFVCPAMNGVLAQGLEVDAPLVRNVVPVSKSLHM